jgi:hypothetical protein
MVSAPATFLLVTMVALTLLQIVTRYGLHAGFEWTEELARLDLVYEVVRPPASREHGGSSPISAGECSRPH